MKDRTVGWKFQNTLKELEEWAPWALDTLKKFRDDLHTAEKKESTNTTAAVSERIFDTIKEIESSFKILDKDVRRAQGKRVNRD